MSTQGTIDANGSTDSITCSGPMVFNVSGTWGSGAFSVQYKSPVTGAWVSLSPVIEEDTSKLVDLPEHVVYQLRATLAGATSPDLAWEFIGQVSG